jgi:serine/threonine protein kinase
VVGKHVDDLAPGDVFAERFLLEAALGEGGFGRVFRARHTVTQGALALKVLRPEVFAHHGMAERFGVEVRAPSAIGSPHIVAVHDVGVDAATRSPWLTMELLEGESLDTRLKREGALPWAAARGVFRQLGEAFGAAHAAGVLHLDVKPENLFLARSVGRRDDDPLLRVLDFGIARLLADGQTHATVDAMTGSPLWMAPEQSELGAHVRASADVWALGLVAFRMLSGITYWRTPRQRGGVAALLAEVLMQPLEPASVRAAAGEVDPRRLPPGFDAWFARCVQRDAGQRFAEGREAMEALVGLFSRSSPDRTVGLDATPRAPLGLSPAAPRLPDPSREGVAHVPAAADTALAWRTRGETSMQLGMAQPAVTEFSRALALSPRDVRALLGRAQAWRALRQAELAAADEAMAFSLGALRDDEGA